MGKANRLTTRSVKLMTKFVKVKPSNSGYHNNQQTGMFTIDSRKIRYRVGKWIKVVVYTDRTKDREESEL